MPAWQSALIILIILILILVGTEAFATAECAHACRLVSSCTTLRTDLEVSCCHPLKKLAQLSMIPVACLWETAEACHCPCTGKIGGLRYKEMAGLLLPCLLSPGTSATRKTKYTGAKCSPTHRRHHPFSV